MTKLKNEAELVKEALRVGMIYAKSRGQVTFEATDSQKEKIEYVYRLLVHDKQIQPLPKGEADQPQMKHKLAFWLLRNLPENHPLKQ